MGKQWQSIGKTLQDLVNLSYPQEDMATKKTLLINALLNAPEGVKMGWKVDIKSSIAVLSLFKIWEDTKILEMSTRKKSIQGLD